MVGLTDIAQTDITLVISTLVFQITVLLAGGLLIATRYKHHAAIRYGVTFTTLMLTVPLIALSVFLQTTDNSVINMRVVPQSWVATQQSIEPELSSLQITPAIEQPALLETGAGAGLFPSPISFDALSIRSVLTLEEISVAKMLLSFWLIGFAMTLANVVRSFVNVRKIQNSAGVLERNDLEHVLCLCGRDKAKKYNIEFRESSAIKSPVVAGVLQPMILLPTRFLWKLNNAQFRAILLHELGHIERRDTLANLLQKIVMAVLWFHPLAYTLDKQISKAREEVCDNCVLAEQPALEYGEALLHARLATTHVPGKVTYTAGSIGIFGGSWRLEQRIKELIDVEREKTVNLELEDKIGIYLSFSLLALVLSLSQISTASDERQIISDVASQEQLPESASTTLPAIGSVIPVNYYSDVDFTESFPQSRLVVAKAVQGSNRFNSSNGSWQPLYGQTAPRLPPPTRSSDTLSDTHRPFESNDLETLKTRADELFESRFENMGDFEKSTLLSFYANYYSRVEDYPAAIDVNEQMLSLESLNEDIKLRTLRALGELQWKGGNYADAIGYYEHWLTLSNSRNPKILLKLANSYMEIKDYEKAMAILIEMQNADAMPTSGGDIFQM